MFKRSLGYAILFLLVKKINCVHYIYDTCKYSLEGEKDLLLSNRTWHVQNTDGKVLHFSPCGTKLPECNFKSAACISDSHLPGHILHLGDKYEYKKDEQDAQILMSSNGTVCSPAQNWRTIIQFDCFTTKTLSPRFEQSEEDECLYNIYMLKSDCSINCAAIVDGGVVDLRSLRNTPSLIINDENGTFAVKLCGYASECKNNSISACFYNGTETVPIATHKTQHVVYNIEKNLLSVRGNIKYGMFKNDIRNLEITLKCNWYTNFTNARYLRPRTQGKNYKFIVESSYGCVIKPHKCQDKDGQNYKYDLTKLHRPNDKWKVQNVRSGEMFLNICGPLAMPYNNSCTSTYSQVCHFERGVSENRGSVFSSLEIDNNSIKTSFTDGSVCKQNGSVLLKTNLELECSNTGSDPIMRSYSNCTTNLIWKTPSACPFYETFGDNCNVLDELDWRNLTGVHTGDDKVFNVTRNLFLRYNLCGPLVNSCANQNNVGVCLVQNGKEFVFGALTTRLRSYNGMLSLEMVGNHNLNFPEIITVNFFCDYAAPVEGRRVKEFLNDKCVITVHTPLACLPSTTVDCKVRTYNSEYDLSPLTRLDRNYVINDIDPDVQYVINICRPILTSENALCMMNTTICRSNGTNPNIKFKYRSLSKLSEPRYANGELFIENFGQYCDKGQNYYSVIHFECSTTNEMTLPTVLKKEPCRYEFLWQTKYACPKQLTSKSRNTRSCQIPDSNNEKSRTIQSAFRINYESKRVLQVNFCEGFYKNFKDDVLECESSYMHRTVLSEYLEVKLNDSCAPSVFNTIQVQFECGNGFQKEDKTMENYGISIKRTVFNITSENIHDEILIIPRSTNTKCPEKEIQKFGLDVTDKHVEIGIDPIVYVESEKQATSDAELLVKNNDNHKYNFESCKIVHSGSDMPINSFKSFTVSKYVVNLAGDSAVCNGFICKDGIEISNFNCPIVTFNYSQSLVKLNYSSDIKCDKSWHAAEIRLTCQSAYESPRIIQESMCTVIIEYPTSKVCSLLQKTDKAATHAAIIAVSISGSITAVLLFCLIYFLKVRNIKCCNPKRYHGLQNKSRSEVIYLKDAQM